MEARIRALLRRLQCSEQCKETAAFRIALGGEAPGQVMAGLGIHNRYALRSGVRPCQRTVPAGLVVGPAMRRTQKRAVQALRQRNGGLGPALPQAKLRIVALHTILEVAEQERQVPRRKKSGTQRS